MEVEVGNLVSWDMPWGGSLAVLGIGAWSLVSPFRGAGVGCEVT